MNIAYNMDCMEAMRQMPDNAFDLAVVDPPYGVNRFLNNQPTRLNRYGSMATANDLKPTAEYFQQLFRVSKNQVIWGYNHLSDLLPTTKEFIFWYKHQCVETYSDVELAWTSFTKTAKCFDFPYYGAVGADPDRIHPTQKPVALYIYIYRQYAKKGDKILDTHLGSGSSRIAAFDSGLDFVGYEINKEFFDRQEERFARHIAQTNLFLEEGL